MLFALALSLVASCRPGRQGAARPGGEESPSPEGEKGAARPRGKESPSPEGKKAGELSQALSEGKSPQELEALAKKICKDGREEPMGELVVMLDDSKFLAKLAEPGEDAMTRDGGNVPEARLERVLREFAAHQPKKAVPVFLKLAANPQYATDKHFRLHALLHACGEFHSPPKEILDFLEDQAAPDSWQSNIFPDILVEMGAKESLDRLEKRFLTPRYNKYWSWFTHRVISLRDKEYAVDMYRRILEHGVADENTRNLIVQTLYVSRLPDWYAACGDRPKIPDRREASDRVLGKLLSIADLSKSLNLTSETTEIVSSGRKQIEGIISFRKSGKPAIIAKQIANLDSSNFQLRDKATRELRAFGDWALPQLRKALENPPSAESRTRIESVIRAITEPMKNEEKPR